MLGIEVEFSMAYGGLGILQNIHTEVLGSMSMAETCSSGLYLPESAVITDFIENDTQPWRKHGARREEEEERMWGTSYVQGRRQEEEPEGERLQTSRISTRRFRKEQCSTCQTRQDF